MPNHQRRNQKQSTNVRDKKGWQVLMRMLLQAMGVLFPGKASEIIRQRFFKPVRRKLSPEERLWLDRARPFQIQVHGKTIHCWKWGHGPQILVIHGWNGRGVNLQPLFPPLLRHGYAIVCFDAPAHGRSDGVHTNYFEFTDTVRALVNVIGKHSIAGVLAHSLGASAAINCLSKEAIAPPTVLIAPALRLRELLINAFNRNGVPARLYRSIMAELEAQYGYGLERDNPFTLLEKFDARVLIVHDLDDSLIPFADARSIAERNSAIVLHVTRGLGHKAIIGDIRTREAVVHYLSDALFDMEARQKIA